MTAFAAHGSRPPLRARNPASAVESVRTVPRDPVEPAVTGVVMDLVVPAREEQQNLETFVRRLEGYLSCYFPYSYRLTLVDLASADRTLAVAERLDREIPAVHAVHSSSRDAVAAIRSSWAAATAPVVAAVRMSPGMDMAVLPPLVAPLVSGHCDVAFGTDAERDPRFARTVAQRSLARFEDRRAPAGRTVRRRRGRASAVAVRADAAKRVLPLLREEAGTVEAQLLALSIRGGLRVFGMPVERVAS